MKHPSPVARSRAELPDPSVFYAPVTRRVLPNGLTVLLRPVRRQPVVSVHLAVRSGAMHEGALLGSGLSHFLEHALFLGTKRRPGHEAFSTGIEALGGSDQNAHTAHDHTAFYFTVERSGLAQSLDLLSDLLFHPLFQPARIRREKGVIAAEMDMDRDDPESRMAQDFMERAFPTHACREPVIGRPGRFRALGVGELADWHRRRFVPGAMALALVGDFEETVALRAVEKYFAGETARFPEPDGFGDEREAPRESRGLMELPLENPRLRLSWPACAWNHGDAAAFDLLETLLGWGKTCTFWKAWMSRGIFAGMEASSWTPSFRGLFDILLTLHGEQAAKSAEAVRRFLAELPGAILKLGEADLERARHKVHAEAVSALENTPGLASNLAMSELQCGRYDWEISHLEAMAAVTRADLARLAPGFSPEKLHAVLYAPKGQAKRFAPVLPAPALEKAGGKPRRPDRDHGAPGERVRRSVIANGATLLQQLGEGAGMAHLTLLFAGGQEFEGEADAGLFHHLVRLMPEGAKGWNSERLQERFEGRGGFLQPHSGPNHFGFSLSYSPSEEARIFEALERVLCAPAFPAAAFEVERKRSLESLAFLEESVGEQARLALYGALWGRHAYALPAFGTAQSIRKLSISSLRDAHGRYVRGGNAVAAFAGGVSPLRLARLLEKLPEGGVAFPQARPPALRPAEPVLRRLPKDQTLVHWAFHGPGFGHPEGRWYELLSAWMNGLGGPLFALRGEDGLAYQVGFSRHVRRDVSALVFGLSLGKGNGRKWKQVIAKFKAALAPLSEKTIPEGELARAAAVLRGSRGLASQAWLEECQGLAAHERLGSGWKAHYQETHFPRAASALREGLCRAAGVFDPGRAVTVLTGRLT